MIRHGGGKNLVNGTTEAERKEALKESKKRTVRNYIGEVGKKLCQKYTLHRGELKARSWHCSVLQESEI